jgi:hypothetical protein
MYYDNSRTRTLLRNGRTKQGKTSTWNGLMTSNNNNQKIADADLGRSLSTSIAAVSKHCGHILILTIR